MIYTHKGLNTHMYECTYTAVEYTNIHTWLTKTNVSGWLASEVCSVLRNIILLSRPLPYTYSTIEVLNLL